MPPRKAVTKKNNGARTKAHDIVEMGAYHRSVPNPTDTFGRPSYPHMDMDANQIRQEKLYTSEYLNFHTTAFPEAIFQELSQHVQQRKRELGLSAQFGMFPHQRDGIEFLWRNYVAPNKKTKSRGAMLADDMGLGKTIQTLGFIYILKKTGMLDKGPVLIIVPPNLKSNWAREVEKWFPNQELEHVVAEPGNRWKNMTRDALPDIVITGYTTIRDAFKKQFFAPKPKKVKRGVSSTSYWDAPIRSKSANRSEDAPLYERMLDRRNDVQYGRYMLTHDRDDILWGLDYQYPLTPIGCSPSWEEKNNKTACGNNLFYGVHWGAIFLDESHYAKNRQSRIAYSIFMLAQRAVFLLSGTPLQLSSEDLYTALMLLRDRLLPTLEKFVKQNTNEDIRSIIKQVCIRRVVKELAQQPELSGIVIPEFVPRFERISFANQDEERRHDWFEYKLSQQAREDGGAGSSMSILKQIGLCRMDVVAPVLTMERGYKEVSNVMDAYRFLKENKTFREEDDQYLQESQKDLAGDEDDDVRPAPSKRRRAAAVASGSMLSDDDDNSNNQMYPHDKRRRVTVSDSEDDDCDEDNNNDDDDDGSDCGLEIQDDSAETPLTRYASKLKYASGRIVSGVYGEYNEGAPEKALVFCWFAEGVFLLYYLLKKLGVSVYMITGKTSMAERPGIISAFQQEKGAAILVLSTKTSCEGLNITEATLCYHISTWYNPFVERQANGRAYRIGQMKRVIATWMILDNTIEEEIYSVGLQRMRFADNVMDGKDMPTDRSFVAELVDKYARKQYRLVGDTVYKGNSNDKSKSTPTIDRASNNSSSSSNSAYSESDSDDDDTSMEEDW